jgi:hypothetical protein
VVLEMRVGLHLLASAEHRPPAVLVAQKNARQPVAEFVRDLDERQLPAGAGRAFDRQPLPVILAEFARAGGRGRSDARLCA